MGAEDDRPPGDMLYRAESNTISKVNIQKVRYGAFFTKSSSWLTSSIRSAIESTKIKSFADPFAGEGDLLKHCLENFGGEIHGYDIDESLQWETNDSLLSIPPSRRFLCISNPPFLAKNSARRKSMWSLVGHYFENSGRSDLYEIALDRCLNSFKHVVIILPETFLHSSYSKERCQQIVILQDNPFLDTTFPVCVTYWSPETTSDPAIYVDDKYIMTYNEMMMIRKGVSRSRRVVFNDPGGNIGLRAVDGTESSVRLKFIPGGEFDYPRDSIKVSSRAMTYISIPELSTPLDVERFCINANIILENYRKESSDIIFAGFKGNNNNGIRRRRLDYALARKIAIEALDRQ
jgi:hypothetical protein